MPGPKGCACNAANAPPLGVIPQHSGSPIPSRTSAGNAGAPEPQKEISFATPTPPPPDIPPSGHTKDKEKPKTQSQIDREKEEELKKWSSPLRKFDVFASGEERRREIAEEDFPRLKVPQLKGHHKCKVSSLLSHQVDYAVEMEQELRSIGIQETFMLDMLEKLTRAEQAVRFQGAVRAAEVAAMSAPPDLAEEASVAAARGYTVETHEISKKSSPGDNPIEIVGYIGCTRPNNF